MYDSLNYIFIILWQCTLQNNFTWHWTKAVFTRAKCHNENANDTDKNSTCPLCLDSLANATFIVTILLVVAPTKEQW